MLSDIIVPVTTYPDPPSAETVARLVALARGIGETVTLCPVAVDLPNLEGRWGAGLINVAQMTQEAEQRSRQASAAVLAAAGGDVRAEELRVALENVEPRVAMLARTHDLTVIAAGTQNRALTEHLVFEAGRPVLVVPEAGETQGLKRVALAWDGSRVAARAVHDAMPLVAKAEAVHVVTAFDDKQAASETVGGLIGYLERHGVKAFHEDVSAEPDGVGLSLQKTALWQGAGLLVMGAYGHSRLRQFVLGGATRGVLEDTRLPVLLSH